VDLTKNAPNPFGFFEEGIHWVICGGESGANARPMHPDWARNMRNECEAAGVPFFFKQWGEWLPLGQMIELQYASKCQSAKCDIEGVTFVNVGKQAAGRLLDGIEYNEFPAPPSPEPARDVCAATTQTPRPDNGSAKTPRQSASPSREMNSQNK